MECPRHHGSIVHVCTPFDCGKITCSNCTTCFPQAEPVCRGHWSTSHHCSMAACGSDAPMCTICDLTPAQMATSDPGLFICSGHYRGAHLCSGVQCGGKGFKCSICRLSPEGKPKVAPTLGDGTTSDITSNEHAMIVGGVYMALQIHGGKNSPLEWDVEQELTSNNDIQPYLTMHALGKDFRIVIAEMT